jgi:glycylpeptide N-tetradecanoyltransferase
MAPFPSVVEVLQHPAFPTAVFNLKPTREGRTLVGAGRGGPFTIVWQIHGSGPIRVVVSTGDQPIGCNRRCLRLIILQVVSGLGSKRYLWQRQALYFGHEHGDKYSFLLVDNRGIEESDVPLMRYTTADMAYDIAEVFVDVGWLRCRPSLTIQTTKCPMPHAAGNRQQAPSTDVFMSSASRWAG